MIIPGAAINVKLLCNSGHTNSWSSSEGLHHKKRIVFKVNIKLMVYLFLSGLQFQVFKVSLSATFSFLFCDYSKMYVPPNLAPVEFSKP